MDNWPVSLPCPLAGASYSPVDTTIRTQMDAGPAKVRRRYTAGPADVSIRLLCSEAQMQTLDDFASITLGGTLPFLWRDWRKPAGPENEVVYRFKRPPVYEHAGPGLWYASLELEMLYAVRYTPPPPPGEAVLSDARIFVDWSDAANHDGMYATNQNDPRTPIANVIAFPTGDMANEGGTLPTTYRYAAGPTGGMTAARLLSSSTNQSFLVVKSTHTPLTAAGPMSIRFRARANPGTGPHAISFGGTTSGGLLAGSVQDLDWSNPANEAATTFSHEFTYEQAGQIVIRLPASGADVLIDHLQVHYGPLSTMPAFSSVPVGGRKAFAGPGSLPLDANGLVDITGHTSGLLAFDPAYPNKHTYAEYTAMVVASVNDIPAGDGQLFNLHPNDGGTSTANALQVEGGAPYSGEVVGLAGTSSRVAMGVVAAGKGIFIAGQSRDAAIRTVYIDTVPAYIDPRAFAGVTASRFTTGSWTTTNYADLRGMMLPGKHAFFALWDRKLTDQEWKDAANALRARLTQRGVAMMPFTDYHVISGDSNSTRGAADWTQLIAAEGFMSPQRNMFITVTSVGGQGLDDLERDRTGVDAGLPDGTITANGRFGKQDQPALLGGVEDGRYSLYHLPIGTNDWDLLNAYGGDNAAKASAYCARVQAFITHALATHERVHVMWYSLLPQNADSAGRTEWEAQRLLVNSEMATWIASQPRVHLCDFGGSPTIGSRALQDQAGGGPYYLYDEIHLDPSGATPGDVEAASIVRAAVKAWRTSLGIA